MDDGRLFFSVKLLKHGQADKPSKQHVFFSPPFWDDSPSGKWLMICTTYDVDSRKVTHFIDGQAISVELIPNKVFVESISIGEASICNWSEPMYRTDESFIVRNLNGSIDEFAIFPGAISADEVARLFEAGTAYEN